MEEKNNHKGEAVRLGVRGLFSQQSARKKPPWAVRPRSRREVEKREGKKKQAHPKNGREKIFLECE